VKSAVFYL